MASRGSSTYTRLSPLLLTEYMRSTRTFSAPTKILTKHLSRLLMFTKITDLSLDFLSEGLSTQQLSAKRIFSKLSDCSNKITCLTITYLPRIDVSFLRLLATNFPQITNLWLSSTERLDFSHCWYCLEESLECTIHSPLPECYIEVEDMAVCYTSIYAVICL